MRKEVRHPRPSLQACGECPRRELRLLASDDSVEWTPVSPPRPLKPIPIDQNGEEAILRDSATDAAPARFCVSATSSSVRKSHQIPARVAGIPSHGSPMQAGPFMQ